MQKSAKFILPLLLTAALLFGFTGCADKNETPTNPTTEAATAESTAAPTTPVILQAPVMETEDWDAYTPTKYQDKEHLSVTLNLTADLTAQDTILYQDGNKYAELVGVIVPAKDQTAFDNLELNKDYNGVEYKEKGTGTLPSGTRYTYIMDDFGTMADFDRLLSEVHQRGMRLIMDLVVNHTSDEHPWFEAAKQDRHNKYHQYYIWRRDDGSHTPPNNWESLFSGSAWNYYEAVDSWAMHAFSKKQMDLNWENPAVRHDIYKMINWWLDKGIDGFRMDVINFISKWPSLPDGDPVVGKTLGFCGAEFYFYGPCLHAYLHEMNRNCFGRGDKEYVTVGECGGLGIETAKLTTADTRQELSMVFNFDHLDNAGHMRFDEYQYDLRKAVKTILKWQVEYTNHCWPTLLFENHDNPRVTSKVDPTDTYTPEIAKLCAVLEMTLKGSPFIYQGQELGMTNTHFDSMDDVRDVESINFYNKLVAKGKKPEKALRIINGGSRDHGRTPMQWTAEPGAGFTDGTPWIGINKNAVCVNAADEAKVPDSVLNDFKRLIALRHANPALVYGEFTQLCPEDKNVVCYKRTLDGNTFFVELNLTGERQNRPYDPVDFKRLYSNYHDHRDVLMPFEANVYLAEGEAKA